MTKRIYTFALFLLAGILFPWMTARADLTITPWRVVFQARDRSATVILLNTTDHTNTYRFGWMLMKATPDGKYDNIMNPNDKDPHSVANMILFAPRQVTIEPHGQQTVRLSLRRPADLPPGEYRAHMTMTRMAQGGEKPQETSSKGIELALNVNLGFSIPVIVRQGEDKDLKISLTKPEFKMQGVKPVLKLDVNRDAGKFSSYGTVKVFWKQPGGEEKQIGQMGNVALYPEIQTRHISVPINPKENLTAGAIHVVYEGKYESEGMTWAETTFPIGK